MFPPKCMYPYKVTTKYLSSQNGAITSTYCRFVVFGLPKRVVNKKAPQMQGCERRIGEVGLGI